MSPFSTWKHQGVAFIAARTADGYSVADANGGYYGAWQNFEEFRRRQRNGDQSAAPIGRVSSISVRAE